MKLLGAGLLLCTGVLAGCAAARRLERRAALLRLLRRLLTEMMQELADTLPLTAELLKHLAANPLFLPLQFLQEAATEADHFPQSWQNAVNRDTALPADAASVLVTVGQTLGSMPLEGQLAALRLCLERLGTLQTEAETRAAEKGNLCRSMGILGALFFTILLL